MTPVIRDRRRSASGTAADLALDDCTLTRARRADRRPGRPQRRRQVDAARAGLRHDRADQREHRGARAPARRPAPTQLARVGFVAQDAPVYSGLSVADHLRLGARLNPRWDASSRSGGSGSSGWTPPRRPAGSPAASAPSSP